MGYQVLKDDLNNLRNGNINVLLLLRKGVGEREFVETLRALSGVSVEVFYRPDHLDRSMIEHDKKKRQVLVFDADLSDPADLRLIGLLKVEGVGLVALADRATDMAAIKAIRAGADDVLLRPINPAEALEVLSRVVNSEGKHGVRATGSLLAFMHASGGAGATTLAVNVAELLQRDGSNTCLLDMDFQFGTAGKLLDLDHHAAIQDILDDPSRLDREMFESLVARHRSGLRVLTAPATPLPLGAFSDRMIDTLLQLAKSSSDFVVADLPVALEDWTESLLREANTVFIVSPSTVIGVHRARLLINMIAKHAVDAPPIKIILNRYSGHGHDSSITSAQFAKAVGCDVDFIIPAADDLIGQSHDEGKAAVEMRPKSEFARCLDKLIASTVPGKAPPPTRHWFFG